MLKFRRASIGDIPAIMEAVHQAQAFMRTLDIDQWQDGYPEESLIRQDIDIGQLYVVTDATGVPGALAALSLLHEPIYDDIEGAWLTDGPYLTIHRMACGDALRGRGAAALILENALRIARDNGCVSVRADTHRGNLAMRRFMAKQGFAQCGQVLYPIQPNDPVRVAYERLL